MYFILKVEGVHHMKDERSIGYQFDEMLNDTTFIFEAALNQ